MVSACVFCGGKKSKISEIKLVGDDRKTWRIKCNDCPNVLSGFDTKKEAVAEWNGMKTTADLR